MGQANDLIVVEKPKEIEIAKSLEELDNVDSHIQNWIDLAVDAWTTPVGHLDSDVPRGKPCKAVSPSGKICRKIKSPHWCEAEAEIIDLFWAGLRLIEDPFVGEVFELISWFRKFLLDTLTIKRWNATKGYWERHYRVGYIIIPKGNMKSTGLGGIALYFLATMPPGSYSCLTAQGKGRAMMNIYRIINEMMAMSPVMDDIPIKWEARLDRWVRTTPGMPDVIMEIVAPERFDAKRGPRTRFAIVDEFAFIPTIQEFFNVVRKAWFSQPEPFLVMATTPSKDPLAWERQMTPRMYERLANPCFMPRWYPVIYAATDNDDMDDPENWLKWNPAIEFGVGDLQILQDEHDESEGDPAARNDFYTDRCASPRDTKAAFIQKDKWDLCYYEGGMAAVRQRMYDLPAYVAFDLSETSDMSAMSIIVVNDETREMFVDAYAWVPNTAVQYLDKKLSGKITEWLDDETVPFFELPAGKSLATDVAEHSLRILEAYSDIRFIGYDPRSSVEASAIWREHFKDFAMVKGIQQGYSLNESIRLARDLVSERQLWHGGNPVLDYCVLSADLAANNDGYLRIVKYERSSTPVRTDAAVAMVTAIQARKAWRYYVSQQQKLSEPEGFVGAH